MPQPAPDELRVRLHAAALNHRELWITRGLYPNMTLPTMMGADGAGVVDCVGQDVDRALLGQAVMLYPGLDWGDNSAIPARSYGLLGMPGPGTIAQAICVRADRVVAKPADLDFSAAAACPLAGLTAWRGLFTKACLRKGEKLLVTGAGGGVAGFAIQFAVSLGATVFVTSSSADTLAHAMAAGAMGGVNYRDPDWGRELAALAGGIDVVFDGAPAGGYGVYARALNQGARVIIYGASGGNDFPIRSSDLFLKNLVVAGTNVGNLQEFRAMVDFMTHHAIRPSIDRIFTLDDAPAALIHLEQGHQFGKVVIRVQS